MSSCACLLRNTRQEEQPDIECAAPWEPRADYATSRGRSVEACCECHEVTHEEQVTHAFCME